MRVLHVGDQSDPAGPEARVFRHPRHPARGHRLLRPFAQAPCTSDQLTPTFSNTPPPRITLMMPAAAIGAGGGRHLEPARACLGRTGPPAPRTPRRSGRARCGTTPLRGPCGCQRDRSSFGLHLLTAPCLAPLRAAFQRLKEAPDETPGFAAHLPSCACGTPQEQCINRNTRDLRTVDRLIAETEGNLDRGYALKPSLTMRITGPPARATVGRKGRRPPVPRRGCAWTSDPVTRPAAKAIDLNEEARKLEGLKAKRKELARQAERSSRSARRIPGMISAPARAPRPECCARHPPSSPAR